MPSAAFIILFTLYTLYRRMGVITYTEAKPSPLLATVPTVSIGRYKDGIYKGTIGTAYYGKLQVQVTVTGGNITDVDFIDHPVSNSTTKYIHDLTFPLLASEAIRAQGGPVDTITGATFTTSIFNESLAGALEQAESRP